MKRAICIDQFAFPLHRKIANAKIPSGGGEGIDRKVGEEVGIAELD